MDRIFFSALFVILFVNNIIGQKVSNKVGDSIYGDFNGDKKFEYAFRKLIKKGIGNPVENGSPSEYEIKFSDKSIKSINVGCCWFKLINEGDLDNNISDEITIIQSPENGCIGNVQTFSLKDDKKTDLIDSFSMFICADLTDDELQKLIVLENNIVYYHEADPNDENLLNDDGDKIIFERLKKIKAFENKPKVKKTNNALNSLKSNKDKTSSEDGTGKVIKENYFGNRKIIHKPILVNTCNEFGIVTIEVVVDRNGKVLSASNGKEVIVSSCLIKAAKEAALNTKWEADENAPERHLGHITYNFH
ncbi:hypothetical protein V3Q90_09485 [Flavobacterium oreochromis]|uniref:TonB C-terminal domain-containing protein n=1 Tax=Flavobacterium oreochromis TaxID=2906078 RepID=A0ABW8P8Y3_9FLAO|nr:hypothetical protein [Flavobacterium oreochromis]OWP74589.1 hypothetical protein BWG23_13570 [Flavobacterium oreochromis]